MCLDRVSVGSADDLSVASSGYDRRHVREKPHLALPAGDASALVGRAPGHRRGDLQRWAGLCDRAAQETGRCTGVAFFQLVICIEGKGPPLFVGTK